MSKKLALFIGLAVTYVVFVAAIAAGYAADKVGCATIEWELSNNGATVSLVSYETTDYPNVRVASVGNYLWLQYAPEVSSTENVVSYPITGDEPNPILLCTDWVPEGEVIEQGPGSARVVEVGTDAATRVGAVVSSALSPHPEIVDAWISESGLVVL